MEKKKPSFTAGGNVNWYSHDGKQYGGSSKKFKIKLPYNPVIPFLVIYPPNLKTFISKAISIPMFIAALLMVAKPWK